MDAQQDEVRLTAIHAIHDPASRGIRVVGQLVAGPGGHRLQLAHDVARSVYSDEHVPTLMLGELRAEVRPPREDLAIERVLRIPAWQQRYGIQLHVHTAEGALRDPIAHVLP